MKIRLDLKIFILIILFYFTRQIQIYSLLMIFALLHEIGHMIAGLLLGFKPDTISIMPVGVSIDFNINTYDYNKKIKNGNRLNFKKIIISLAGPLTNVIIVLINFIFGNNNNSIIYSNLLLAIFNLMPIYPLDGGRILKNILSIFWGRYNAIKYTNTISNIFICILTMFTSIFVLQYKNVFILLILSYLWYLVLNQNKRCNMKLKLIEAANKIRETELKNIENIKI